MNGDKGPFRAAVSGLKSSRDRALAVALAGPFVSGLSPSSLHNARVLPAGALLEGRALGLGTSLQILVPLQDLHHPGQVNIYIFKTCFPLLKNGHKNCPGDLTRVITLK